MDERIAQWLVSGGTGASSMSIVARLNGAAVDPFDYPRDPSDLGRCIRLLEKMPEYRARLHEMGWISPMWRHLVNNWDELVSLYNVELPTDRAPQCYARMRELIEQGEREWEAKHPGTFVHLKRATIRNK